MKRLAWFCLWANALAIPLLWIMAWLVGAQMQSRPVVIGGILFSLLSALGAGFAVSIVRGKAKDTRFTLLICTVCTVFSASILLSVGFWLSGAAH